MNKKTLLIIAVVLILAYIAYRMFFKKNPIVFSNIDWANKTATISFNYQGQTDSKPNYKWSGSGGEILTDLASSDRYSFGIADDKTGVANSTSNTTLASIVDMKTKQTVYESEINWDTKQIRSTNGQLK